MPCSRDTLDRYLRKNDNFDPDAKAMKQHYLHEDFLIDVQFNGNAIRPCCPPRATFADLFGIS